MQIFTRRPATLCPARRTVVAKMAADQSAALSAVERTANAVASKRALEAQRPLSLVCDPVIGSLVPGDPWWPQLEASQQAELADLRAAAAAIKDGTFDTVSASLFNFADGQDTADNTQVGSGLTLRCRFVEDELLHLLHGMRKALVRHVAGAQGSANGSANDSCGSEVRPYIQVVMLGAGLDTRPWRLPLGHDVSWFELDLTELVAFKRGCMERAGMQAEAPACNADLLKASVPASGTNGTPPPRFPLQVGRWASLPADLSQPSSVWLQQLEGAGWERGLPTLWVAEGLIYYLEQEQADQLIQATAAASQAAGLGALIISSLSPTGLKALQLLQQQGSNGAWPAMKGTLGDDPAAALLKAGWAAAEATRAPEFELHYRTASHKRPVPESIEQQATALCGGVPMMYYVATATTGL